jgi:D-3-phosphoglycerate dehydrogenase
MKEVKILVCDPIHEEGVRMLRKAGLEVDLKTSITDRELIETVGKYDAIVVRSRTKVTDQVLQASERLKAVARAGVGLDNIDLEAARRRDIKILNTPEAPSNAVAELVLGLMFCLARRIPEADASMKRGEWIKKHLTGFELKGKTLGIIGFGRIGYLLAKKAKGMEMRVVTYDIIIDKLIHLVEEVSAEAVSMKKLLAESDFISIHVPLLAQTRHMISENELSSMKDGAYLINAARGGILNEEALLEALKSDKLAGAALDVYEKEPSEDTFLTGLKNVVALPHIGAQTEEAQICNSKIVAEKLIKHFSAN